MIVCCSVGSWAYSGNDIRLQVREGSEALDLSYYNSNCSLAIESHTAGIVAHSYPCCDEPYPSMEVSIVFNKRQ